ncbi:hypothetical protein HG531_012335 [Fusarium graminearum]|nr:hypothetical protein HG531_012335 [Fusarium graminearum]
MSSSTRYSKVGLEIQIFPVQFIRTSTNAVQDDQDLGIFCESWHELSDKQLASVVVKRHLAINAFGRLGSSSGGENTLGEDKSTEAILRRLDLICVFFDGAHRRSIERSELHVGVGNVLWLIATADDDG